MSTRLFRVLLLTGLLLPNKITHEVIIVPSTRNQFDNCSFVSPPEVLHDY